MKKLNMPEGTWFAVPLRNGGFARGLLARADGVGCAFGYFFGPKAETVEALEPFEDLRPQDAILLGQFGDLGLLKGEWQVIGQAENWERSSWPMPPFFKVDSVDGSATLSIYDDDSLDFVSSKPCDPALATKYPEDGLMGYGYVEIRLTRLLES